MRLIFLSIILSILCACSSSNTSEVSKTPEVEEILETKNVSEKIDAIDAEATSIAEKNEAVHVNDSLIKQKIKQLDEQFASTPFYTFIDGQDFYLISNQKIASPYKIFDGNNLFGVVNSALQTLLAPQYEKIYNPNLTIKNCFEIKSKGMVGLFNYQTKEVLKPQFDYILPASQAVSNIAYGYKDGAWFKIENESLSNAKKVNDYNPSQILKSISYDATKLSDRMMFYSYANHYEDDPEEGKGVLINPSYIEYFKLMPNEYYTDLILSNQKEAYFGVTGAKVETENEKSLSGKLKSFFLSIYEEGIDGRGYQITEKQLVLYNSEEQKINAISLEKHYSDPSLCNEDNFHFLNDSIYEVITHISEFGDDMETPYNFATKYVFFKISPRGEIEMLTSDRIYDFTKFINIDQSYFKGCFVKNMEEGESSNEEYNIWQSDYLSIEDLDIMRNEIFAEYGYRFQSEKWQKYFSNKKWYKPRYDNVDDQLTEIDKANIKVILQTKEAMQGKEEKFTKKRPSNYYAAG